jgi:hypothetical protein
LHKKKEISSKFQVSWRWPERKTEYKQEEKVVEVIKISLPKAPTTCFFEKGEKKASAKNWNVRESAKNIIWRSFISADAYKIALMENFVVGEFALCLATWWFDFSLSHSPYKLDCGKIIKLYLLGFGLHIDTNLCKARKKHGEN